MKKSLIIIALLSLTALGANAQSAQTTITTHAACLKPANMPKNATMVFPKSEYTPTQDASCAPCYEYTTKRGLKVMECPFLRFPAEGTPAQIANDAKVGSETASVTTMETRNSYTGNYPNASCGRLPGMPSNATPVYPKSAYTPIGNPACAPCYEYTTKRGLKVMECPNLRFPPEGRD